jgi:hypothetical protein
VLHSPAALGRLGPGHDWRFGVKDDLLYSEKIVTLLLRFVAYAAKFIGDSSPHVLMQPWWEGGEERWLATEKYSLPGRVQTLRRPWETTEVDPLLLRFLERLTVVLFGGMAIYLGFRLFLEVPEFKNSAGEVVLPWDFSIVMTRIGPGVFFALFGVAAVGLALIRPLEINSQGPRDIENESRFASVRYGASPAPDDPPTARADARALLGREFAGLNTIPRLLREDLPEHERDDIEDNIRHVKLTLMKPVWGEPNEGFGKFSEFESWVQDAEPDPPPARMEGALALYRYGSPKKRS